MTITLGLLCLILNVLIQWFSRFSIIKITIINFIICQIHLKLWICTCTHASQKWTESFIQNFSCTIYGSANAGKGIELWEQNLHKSLSEEHSSIFCWPLLERHKVLTKKSCAGLFIGQIIWGWSVWTIWAVYYMNFWIDNSMIAQLFYVSCSVSNGSPCDFVSWTFEIPNTV